MSRSFLRLSKISFIFFFLFFFIFAPHAYAQAAAIIDEDFINDFAQIAQEAAEKYGNRVSAYEIWNEQDASSASSIYIPPQDYASLLSAAYTAIKSSSSSDVIIGGLVSGDIGYLNTVMNNAGASSDGIGVHPYLININSLSNRVTQYISSSHSKPIWITEFGWETSNQNDQSQYLINAFNTFNQRGVPISFWYCWSDGMNPGFGLVDSAGNKKQAYYNFPVGQGINIDPANSYGSPSFSELKDLGAGWVRMVYRPLVESIDFYTLINNYTNAGIKVLLILNQETLSPNVGPFPSVSQEPIIISGASVVSCDFIEDKSSDHEASASSVSLGSKGAIGKIYLDSSKISDLKTAQGIMSGALRNLLPQNLAENIHLPGKVTMYFKHIVQGLKEGEEKGSENFETAVDCDGVPREKTTILPEDWGYLVGGVRGLSSFLAPNNPNAPINRFQFQIAGTNYTCGGSFAPGKEVKAKKLPKTDDRESGFMILVWNIINRIKNLIANYTEVKKVKVLTRSRLPAGSAATKLMENITRGFLPGEISKIITPYDEARALTAGFKYSISFSPPIETGEHPASYFEIKKLRNFYCLDLCSRFPQDINISNIDPLCPSCDPSDYKSPATPRARPKVLPPGCHWNSDYNACDYYEACAPHPHIPQCTAGGSLQHGCGSGQDPVCENCSGLANMLYPDTDLAWCGGQGGSKSCDANPCQILNRISWDDDTYSDPAYNGCYYANDGVKVRRGFIGCSGICSDACPAN